MTDSVRLENVNVEIEYDEVLGNVELKIEEEEITNVLTVQVRQGHDTVGRMIEDMQD